MTKQPFFPTDEHVAAAKIRTDQLKKIQAQMRAEAKRLTKTTIINEVPVPERIEEATNQIVALQHVVDPDSVTISVESNNWFNLYIKPSALAWIHSWEPDFIDVKNVAVALGFYNDNDDDTGRYIDIRPAQAGEHKYYVSNDDNGHNEKIIVHGFNPYMNLYAKNFTEADGVNKKGEPLAGKKNKRQTKLRVVDHVTFLRCHIPDEL